MNDEAPTKPVGLRAQLRAMQGNARFEIIAPGFGASGGDGAGAFRLDELDAAGIGEGFFRRVYDLYDVTVRADRRQLRQRVLDFSYNFV